MADTVYDVIVLGGGSTGENVAARRVAGVQQAVTAGLNAEAVFARRDAFASNWNDEGQARWLDSASVDLVRGHAPDLADAAEPAPRRRGFWPFRGRR